MYNPIYYHLHHQDANEDLPLWNRLAKENGGSILELGCGTGRVLFSLIQAGHEVVGVDISFPALSYLIGQVSVINDIYPQVFMADIQQFCLAREFSLIILACNTLSTLKDTARRRVYAMVNTHLQKGGVFAASIPNPLHLAGLPEVGEPEVEGSFLHPETTNPVQVSSEWRRKNNSIVIYWHYDHLLSDGQVERETLEVEHFLTHLEEYLAELREANLVPLEILGDFNQSEYQKDSPYLILVSRKGAGF